MQDDHSPGAFGSVKPLAAGRIDRPWNRAVGLPRRSMRGAAWSPGFWYKLQVSRCIVCVPLN